MEDCLFCMIAEGKIPSKKLYEDDQVVAFYDINPQAKVHFLVVPRKHISSAAALTEVKETVFTVTGKHQAVVCNYRSVLRYEKEEIILLTFQGKLRIQGKRLKIPMYTPEEMYIEGVITEIILDG